MTRLFLVSAPITGRVEIFVHAETEEEAIEKAATDLTIDNVSEWQEDLGSAEVSDETPDEPA